MLVHAYGEIADDILIEAQQALDLDNRLGRRGNVQEREMSLAVLLDAEGKRLQTPRLDLGDGAAEGGDLGLDLLRQRLDLLLRDVLARQEDMLIKSHFWAFPVQPRPTRSPSSPGKARTFEGGNTGGRALIALSHTRQKWGCDPPFSPRRDATKRPSYRGFRLAARKNPFSTARRSPPLGDLGQTPRPAYGFRSRMLCLFLVLISQALAPWATPQSETRRGNSL